MSRILKILQFLGVVVYGASGVMKVFFFDEVSHDVPSFAALSRGAWLTLGLIELLCCAGLILPLVLSLKPRLAGVAALTLALESLVFVWVHVNYHEGASIFLSVCLGFFMAFLAYGRLVLRPQA